MHFAPGASVAPQSLALIENGAVSAGKVTDVAATAPTLVTSKPWGVGVPVAPKSNGPASSLPSLALNTSSALGVPLPDRPNATCRVATESKYPRLSAPKKSPAAEGLKV